MIKYIQKHDLRVAFAPEGYLSKESKEYYKKQGLDCYHIDDRDTSKFAEIVQGVDSASLVLYNLLINFLQKQSFSEEILRNPGTMEKELFMDYIMSKNIERYYGIYKRYHNEAIVPLNLAIVNFGTDTEYDLCLFWVGGYHGHSVTEYSYTVLWSSAFSGQTAPANISLNRGVFLNTWLGFNPFETVE